LHTRFTNFFHRNKRPQDKQKNAKPHESLTNDQFYYAETWGYKCDAHEVLTEDGYLLVMYRLSKQGDDPKGQFSISSYMSIKSLTIKYKFRHSR
jgi:hypothetical protein